MVLGDRRRNHPDRRRRRDLADDKRRPAGSLSPVAPTTFTPPAPETAEVPNVGGKPIDVATSELEAAGFVVTVETKLTNAVNPGHVFEQSAYPGSPR